jgi:hypothetical protein
LVWIDDGATRQYALHDYYSTIAVTNTSGVVQQRYGFSAYGERKVLDLKQANFYGQRAVKQS